MGLGIVGSEESLTYQGKLSKNRRDSSVASLLRMTRAYKNK